MEAAGEELEDVIGIVIDQFGGLLLLSSRWWLLMLH